MRGTQVPMLGGFRPDKKVEGDGGLQVAFGRAPSGVACKECSDRKQKCYLRELSKERAALKPSLKRKRDEGEQAVGGTGDKPQASGSRGRQVPQLRGVPRLPRRDQGLRW